MAAVLDPSYKVPGAFLKVSLGVGAQSPGSAPRKVLLYGNKNTSSATASAAVPYAIDSEDTARTLFGAGSELQRMAVRALKANPTVPLYGIVVTESAGTAASGTVIFATTSTAATTAVVQIEEKVLLIPVASGATATAVGDLLAAAVTAWTDSPVTAVNLTGTVTLTARHKGPRGNAIRFYGYMDGTNAMTVANSATTLASGATSDDPQTALDATLATRYHYHVSPYSDSTNIAKFNTRVSATAQPTAGLRELVVAASVDTPGNTSTIANALNEARAQDAWQEGGWHTPGEIAAAIAAVRSLEEAADPAFNFDGYVVPGLIARRLEADRPTANEQNTALNAGITPLVDLPNGTVAIVRSVTTHTLDAASHADYRVLDTAKVVVADYVADDLAANWSSFVALSGAKIGPTPTDGSAPPPGVTTPAMARDWIYSRLKNSESLGILENVDAMASQLSVTLSSVSAGRLEAIVPIDVIELLHQLSADVRQVA